ncbi:saccharopine dehydrogenase family protein [Nonomuraea sp. NPDC050556]|uniref:saccharopine dehydrogenase family protein n=1 Tax=Nonomuraea sp. NPDC050556 TaxID=3364369 RepID=UPI0037917A57
MSVVAVFGAYGHTARFVTAELLSRGHTPVLSGRDAAKLEFAAPPGVETRVATVDDPDSLDRALAGADVVINCAGPFAETAPALIEAALRAGIHYLDVTGETIVALDTFGTYGDDQRIKDAGIVVAPVMAFYGALGDLLATVAMGDWTTADDISIAVALDSWQPTRGTLLAGARRAGRRVVFRDRQLEVVPAEEPAPHASWTFGAPFGVQEVVGQFSTTDVITISRHLDTPQVNAYLNLTPLKDLSDPSPDGPQATDASGRSAQVFLVEVAVRRGDEERRASAQGQDIYAFTAPIVVEAVDRILSGRTRAGGVVTAGEIFDPEDFLRALPFDNLSLS